MLFLLGVSGCTGDDTVTNFKECRDGTTVNVTAGEECKPPTPTPTPTPDDEPGTGSCEEDIVGGASFQAGDGDDVLCGDAGPNEIRGGDGEDVIYGRGGNDKLYGEDHDDILHGEAGNDRLDGGKGEDVLNGGPGDDTLIGGRDDDQFNGGPGSDTADYSNAEPADVTLDINLANRYSNDEFGDTDSYSEIENVTGGPGDDTITGDAGNNVLKGGGGDDTIKGGGGNDTIDGGTGQSTGVLNGGDTGTDMDTLVVSDGTGTVEINTSPAVNFENLTDGTEAGGLDLTGNDENNVLTGGSGENTLTGGEGIDTLKGLDGDDTLVGGPGNDILEGGEGGDTLRGGLGVDRLTGGGGGDCFEFVATHTDVDTIRDFNAGDGDTIEVTGTATPVTTGNDVTVKAASNRVILEETDPANDDRVVRTTPLVNVSGLKATDTIGTTGCS